MGWTRKCRDKFLQKNKVTSIGHENGIKKVVSNKINYIWPKT
jgi:hypothetical protein